MIVKGINVFFDGTKYAADDILIIRVNNCEIVAQLIFPELLSGVSSSLNDNAFTTNKSMPSCTPDHVALFRPPPHESYLPVQLWLVKYDNVGIYYAVKEIPHQRTLAKHLIGIDNKTTKIMVDMDDYISFPFPPHLRKMRISSAQFFFDYIQQLAYVITKPEFEVKPTICIVFTVRLSEIMITTPDIKYHFNFVVDSQFRNADFQSNPMKNLLFYILPDKNRFFFMDYSSVLINLRNGIDSAIYEHGVFNFSRAMKSDYFKKLFTLLAPNMGYLHLKSMPSCTPDHVALFRPPPHESYLPVQLWLVKYDNVGIYYAVKEIPHQRTLAKHLIGIDNKTTKIMVDMDDYISFPFPPHLRKMRISSAQFFFDYIQQLAYVITKPEFEVKPTICIVFTVRLSEIMITTPDIKYHFNFVVDSQFRNADFKVIKSKIWIGYNMSTWQRYTERVKSQFFFVLLGWNRCVITREHDFEDSFRCKRDKPQNPIKEWSRNESKWIEVNMYGEPHH